MKTLLDEILHEAHTRTYSRRDVWVQHSVNTGNCSCGRCTSCSNKTSPSSPFHKGFRERKKLRWATPAQKARMLNEFEFEWEWLRESGSTTIPKAHYLGFGKKQHDLLSQHYERLLKNARSPQAKATYQRYLDILRRKAKPDWKQSEKDLQRIFGGRHQAYYQGNPIKLQYSPSGRPQVPSGTVIPDIVIPGSMIEVKNYAIANKPKLIGILKRQIAQRRSHGPADKQDQKILLDLRGQKASPEQINRLAYDVANATSVPHQNVRVITWELW